MRGVACRCCREVPPCCSLSTCTREPRALLCCALLCYVLFCFLFFCFVLSVLSVLCYCCFVGCGAAAFALCCDACFGCWLATFSRPLRTQRPACSAARLGPFLVRRLRFVESLSLQGHRYLDWTHLTTSYSGELRHTESYKYARRWAKETAPGPASTHTVMDTHTHTHLARTIPSSATFFP